MRRNLIGLVAAALLSIGVASAFARSVGEGRAGVAASQAEDTPAAAELVSEAGLKATRVSCGNPDGIDCLLAKAILPAAEAQPTVTVVVQNTGTLAATPGTASLTAIGDRSGSTLTAAQIGLQASSSVEAGNVGVLTFGVAPGLTPDHYVGRLSVGVGDAGKPLATGVDLTIRQGPLIPTVLLLVGLIAGLAIRYARSRWVPAGDAYARWMRLRYNARLVTLRGDERSAFDARLVLARGEIAAGRIESANASLDSIDDSLRLWDLFSALDLALGGRDDRGAVDARAQVAAGRLALRVGAKGQADIESASQAYQLATIAARSGSAGGGVGELSTNETVNVNDVASEAPRIGERESGAAGSSRLVAYSWLRWVITGILVVLALTTGLLTLYVAPETGFIGNGFVDTGTLLLWGMGSGWIDKVFFDWG